MRYVSCNICKPEEGWYGQPKYCYKKQYNVVLISFAVVFGLLVPGMYHSVSTGIFSYTGHCYHSQPNRNYFEIGRLNQLNWTFQKIRRKFDLGSTFDLDVAFHMCRI